MGDFSVWYFVAFAVVIGWLIVGGFRRPARIQRAIDVYAKLNDLRILAQKPRFFFLPAIKHWASVGRYPDYFTILTVDKQGLHNKLTLAVPSETIPFGLPKDALLMESQPFNPRFDSF